MQDEEAARPKPRTEHLVGCDLATFSVEELRLRMALLRDEIVRLGDEERRKLASREAASAFFKA